MHYFMPMMVVARVMNCYSVKCNKQQEKYCVSRAKICTLGDTELSLGPVNGYMLL